MKRSFKISLATLAIGLGASVTAAAAPSPELNVVSQDANSEGSLVIASVTAAENGFVVIHESTSEGKPVVPNSIGHAPVKAGESTSVRVTVDRPLRNGERLFAMLHRDTGKAGVYEFGAGSVNVDQPVAVNGKVVVKPFTISGKSEPVVQAPSEGPAQAISSRDRVYTADQTSNTLTVVNPATNMVLGTLPLGDQRLDGALGPVDSNEVNVHGLGFLRDGHPTKGLSARTERPLGWPYGEKT